VVSHPFPHPPALSVPDNVTAIFEGCVVDPAVVAADRERFTIELAPGARAQVSLFAKPGEPFPALPYGTRIEFTGKVRSPHNYNNPGSFDAVHYFARQQIYWSASADAAGVHILPGRCGNLAARFIFSIRTVSLERLDRLYAGDAYTNGMMQAVLIGATAKLDRMWTEDYRSTGTFHALVISGGHVAVLAAVLLFFLRICAVPNFPALLATLVVAWLYAGITGWQAPVLRSAADPFRRREVLLPGRTAAEYSRRGCADLRRRRSRATVRRQLPALVSGGRADRRVRGSGPRPHLSAARARAYCD
jgi:competence protein ComEC